MTYVDFLFYRKSFRDGTLPRLTKAAKSIDIERELTGAYSPIAQSNHEQIVLGLTALAPGHQMNSVSSSNGMRKEMAARRRCCVNRLHKQFRFYRFLTGDFVEIPLYHRKHEYNEERSRATSFGRYISLRIQWTLRAGSA